MDAEKARRMSKDSCLEEYNKIISEIENAVKLGKLSININSLKEGTRAILESCGYKVIITTFQNSGYFTSSNIEISW